MNIPIEQSWKKILLDEFKKKYFHDIVSFLWQEIHIWKIIYPDIKNIFAALNMCSFENTKVVILWQDPYHWVWQAHGLSFSVQDKVQLPPSLKNIYKELAQEGLLKKITQGESRSWNLSCWGKQWVLLLNSILTVEAGKPASHAKIWWEILTDTIISKLSLQNSSHFSSLGKICSQ